MADIRVEMNHSGAREILNSPEIQAELLRRANRIREAADGMGSGVYAADVKPGKSRAHAMVKTTDFKSMASNAKHNTLLKAWNAGK